MIIKIVSLLGVLFLSATSSAMNLEKSVFPNATHVLAMAEWEQHEYESEKLARLQDSLFEEEKLSFLQEIMPHVNSGEDLFAAFIVYSIFDILIPKITIDNIMLALGDKINKEFIWNPGGNCPLDTLNDAINIAVKKMGGEDYKELAKTIAMDHRWQASWHAHCENSTAKMNTILERLDLNGPQTYMDAAWTLNNLVVIADRINNRREESFNLFSRLQTELSARRFSIPAGKMLAILTAELNNPKVAKNPHTRVFKETFEALGKKVNDDTPSPTA